MTYLKNAWYVGAWSSELTDRPLGRILLDQPVVFYRAESGRIAALEDRCPHRFVPLSLGTVTGEHIRCGYHGLCFDSEGTCVDERFNDNIKSAAALHRYPVEERHGAIWIWMGNEPADSDRIPDFAFLADPSKVASFDQAVINANYTLEIDNLLDLSHLDYVHLSTISNGSFTDGTFTTRQEGQKVHADWWTQNCPIPPQFVPYLEGADRVDQWADVTWSAPSYVYIHSGATRCDRPRTEGYWIEQAHFLTPETATSTHYFWGISRQDYGESDEMADFARARARQAFAGEDGTMLEAQQRAMRGNDFWSEKPLIFPEDASAVRARRILEKMVRAENATLPVEAAIA